MNAPMRWVPIAAAVVAVAAIVVAGRINGAPDLGDQPARPTTGATSPAPTPTAPASPTDAPADPTPGDDGAPDLGDEPATITDGPADPKEAATTFVARFLNTQAKSPEQWRAGFADLVTPELRDLLANADPTRVPVGRVGDHLTVASAGDFLVTVTVPITANTSDTIIDKVKVTLTGASHRWLASELDRGAP